MTVTTQDLTCEEIHTGFDALIERIAELAAERDAAFHMAAQATKDLVRARRQIATQETVDTSRLAVIDDLNTENRRLETRNRELAIENEDLRARHDRNQHPQETPPVRASWWSRRIGNQL